MAGFRKFPIGGFRKFPIGGFRKFPIGGFEKFSIERSKKSSLDHPSTGSRVVVLARSRSIIAHEQYGTVASVPLPSDKRSGSELRAS